MCAVAARAALRTTAMCASPPALREIAATLMMMVSTRGSDSSPTPPAHRRTSICAVPVTRVPAVAPEAVAAAELN